MTAALLVAAFTTRSLLIVNAGDDAIFALRVGHAAQAEWGDDILGVTEVVDVSRGRMIRISFDSAACTYDLQATYRNGTVVVKRDVNLCTAERVDFKD